MIRLTRAVTIAACLALFVIVTHAQDYYHSQTSAVTSVVFPLGTTLWEDLPGTLAQRNGAVAQTFRLYNTTDGSGNAEFMSVTWGSNVAYFQTVPQGTGSPRELIIRTVGNAPLTLGSNTTSAWRIDAATQNFTDLGSHTFTAGTAVKAPFYNSSASSVLSITTNVIAPTTSIHHVGAGLVKTITVPAACTPTCNVDIVPDAAFTTDLTGNISLVSTAVINRTMRFTWDGTKWSPSY